MPDLTPATFAYCKTYDEGAVEVPRSDGGEPYFIRLLGLGVPPSHPGCKGFQYREECKHMDQAMAMLCLWNQHHDGGEVVDEKCPKCGGAVGYYRALV